MHSCVPIAAAAAVVNNNDDGPAAHDDDDGAEIHLTKDSATSYSCSYWPGSIVPRAGCQSSGEEDDAKARRVCIKICRIPARLAYPFPLGFQTQLDLKITFGPLGNAR